MYKGKKIVVVLPAYNAGKTLAMTYNEIPFDIVDDVILVDDCSSDDTIVTGKQLGIRNIICHSRNKGYGGNQKTCYNAALESGADIIVMLHPDYQYTPLLITAMVSIIANGLYPVVFGSRILGKGAIKGGMPLYKYIFNRILTLVQNLLMNQKLSEYHTGYRAYSSDVLRKIDFNNNSDGFVFDNEVIAQICFNKFGIAEVTCPCRYDESSSSIKFLQSAEYGAGVIKTSILYFLTRTGIFRWRLLTGRRP
ncbi:MAG TPA: glycosyltransferase family 2 protein [Bacteroidales bacterium]|jgi:glycosyltransferase involved in cell wall biosynthesis|nr:glycosyltransferase family 2 protein [Bacteroidales bacterium]